MQTCHPLAGVVHWINERGISINADLLSASGPEPSGSEWTRLDRMPERIPESIATLVERSCQGHRTAAAAFLAADIGRQVAAFAAVTAYLTGRAPELSAERTWVRHHESGRLDRMALRQGTVGLSAGDPMANRPGAVRVGADDELDQWFMGAVVDVVEPVFAAVREHTRFGPRPQWNMVADALHAALLQASDEIGADQNTAWDRARRMVQLINRDRPRVTPKQRPFPLAMAGRPEHRKERMFMVRGGCCFYYRFGDSACAACPLTADDERARVLREHYEATVGA